ARQHDGGVLVALAELAAPPSRRLAGEAAPGSGVLRVRAQRPEAWQSPPRSVSRVAPQAIPPKHRISQAGFLLGYGSALLDKGLPTEAITVLEEAVRLDPDLALAHCHLGIALRETGRLADALAALRRGHELGSKNPEWSQPSARWLADCERLLELDGRLT